MNLSSEAPDDLTYTAIAFPSWNPIDPLGPSDPAFTAPGCISECTSAVSQAEADLCAANEAFLCANPTNPVFYNEAVSCAVSCPDGQTFTAIVEAGKYVAGSQGAANELAHNAACAQANSEKTCPGSPTPPPTPGTCVIVDPSPLPEATIGTAYSFSMSFAGTISGTLVWSISDGALPAGLTIDPATGIISGLPTTGGTFNFTVTLTGGSTTCSTPYQMICNDTTCFTNDSALPMGWENAFYVDNINPNPLLVPDSGMQLVATTTGTLPDGMSFSTLGGGGMQVSGTPNSGTAGTYVFTICIGQQPSGGGS
jgi:hypothetical protein